MRFYRIYAIRARAVGDLRLESAERIVTGVGVEDAFHAVRQSGWWPVSVVASGWECSDVSPAGKR